MWVRSLRGAGQVRGQCVRGPNETPLRHITSREEKANAEFRLLSHSKYLSTFI